MSLMQTLQEMIYDNRFLTESQIKIIGRNEDIDPDEKLYVTSERTDLLSLICFDYRKIAKAEDKRRSVIEYIQHRMPGVDTPELYVDAIMKDCERLGLNNIDLVARDWFKSGKFEYITLYGKKGHYFTSTDGTGYDITEFVEEHLQELIGIKHEKKVRGYDVYIIFAKTDGGKENGK